MSTAAYGVLGASFLWPWNALITASSLASQKLEHASPKLYSSFSSTVMTTSSLTNLIANIYLASQPHNYRRRVIYGEVFIALSFIILALVTDLIDIPSLWMTVVVAVVVVSSLGCATAQNGILAITQRIPDPKYGLNMLNGQAVAGILPAVLPLVVGSTSSSFTLSLITFLSVSALSFVAVLLFTAKNNQEYVDLVEDNLNDPETTPEGLQTERLQTEPVMESSIEILQMIKYPCYAILLGFQMSLSYPVFANSVHSRSISFKVFSPVTHLVWNSGDLIGRLLCTYSKAMRIQSNTMLVTYGALRAVLVGALVAVSWLKNPSDFLYLAIMLVFGISNGHLISSAIARAPHLVPTHLKPEAGGLISLVISMGLLLGSGTSFVVAYLI